MAWGYNSIADARKDALSGCQKQKPQEQCMIVMENDRWVAPSQ